MKNSICRRRRTRVVCLVLLLAVLGTILPLPLRGAGRRFGRVFAAEDLAVLKSYAKEVSGPAWGKATGRMTLSCKEGGAIITDFVSIRISPRRESAQAFGSVSKEMSR